VPLGGRVLTPRCPALAQEPDSCRRAARRQGLNTVGYGGRILAPWAWPTAPDVHLSKILIQLFIFENHDKINTKKIVMLGI
jgi:hypothetical protein